MTEQDATEPQLPANHRPALSRMLGSRNAGKEIDDATLCEAHSHLMPELGAELQKLRRIEAARRAAAAPPPPISDSTTEDMPIPTALINDLEKPNVQVPGYSVLREISRGGQAAVYLATQLSTAARSPSNSCTMALSPSDRHHPAFAAKSSASRTQPSQYRRHHRHRQNSRRRSLYHHELHLRHEPQ